MKHYKLIYIPDIKKKNCIFTHIDMTKLLPPVIISREKRIEEEVVFNARKKSEIVEYEHDDYKKLKNKESCPLIIEDGEDSQFSGKFQDLSSGCSDYYTFIVEDKNIYITPIQKWYRFTKKINIIESTNLDETDKLLPVLPKMEDDNESDREEIDFEDVFEDDDGEDFNFEIMKEKKLSRTGRRLRNLVDTLENGDASDVSEIEEEVIEDKEVKEQVKTFLTDDKIKECLTTNTLPIKELIRKLKTTFELNETEKEILKKFIAKYCSFETSNSGEKYLKLKK